MRLRLLALAVAATALGTLAVPANAALHFERACTGDVDALCYHDFCGIIDCVRSDCLVYVGLLGSGNGGICAGPARPRDPAA